MTKACDLRTGMCVRMNGEIHKVVLAEMKVGTAKLPSSVHVRLRDLHSGSQTEQRLHPEAKVEDIEVGSTGLDYSYSDGALLYFLNPQTFDQVAIPKRMLGNYEKFLTDGCRLVVEFFGEEPIDAILPRTADAVVATTGAARHGENDSAPKSATLENGMEVQVPQFIKPGDHIRIDVATGKYLERLH